MTRINRAHIKTRELELQRELSCCPRLTLVLFFSLRRILKGQKETPTTTTKRSSLLEVLRKLSSLLTCSFVRSLSREEEEEEEEEAKRPPITEKSFDETQKATHYQQKATTRRSRRPFSHSYHIKGAHKGHHQGFFVVFSALAVGPYSQRITAREVERYIANDSLVTFNRLLLYLLIRSAIEKALLVCSLYFSLSRTPT